MVEMMHEYKKWQNAYKKNLGTKWTETGKVFTNDFGGWLRPDTFSRWFRSFCKEHHFDKVHVHTLRHTAATIMIMNNIPLKVVSQRLGHTSTTVTNDIYTHVIQRADEMAAEALDLSLFSKKKKDKSE
ncbi:MAG: tyrosine-type recombinase/integrase [Ruminococcus sp.]|nr:tyrosine-type recombinase/integrase [Ruminococcus sp.]